MGTIANIDIKQRAVASGVRHWQIAQALGVSDFTFSRMLRNELNKEKKAEIFHIIDRLATEGDHGENE